MNKENTQTITENLSSDQITTSLSNLKYAVEIRNGHSIDSPLLTDALNIGNNIVNIYSLNKFSKKN